MSEVDKFCMFLPKNIWELVGDTAKAQGFKSDRNYVNVKVRQVARKFADAQVCQGRKVKQQKNYVIPPHLQQTFQNLSCVLGVPTSTIMTMFVVIDAINHLPEQKESPGNGASCSS